jgi:uncharacterized protein (DUF2147 family)
MSRAILPVLLFTLIDAAGAPASPPIVGTWKTIDDETHKPRALVRIEEHDGVLSGRIVKLFRDPGEDPNPVCVDCSGVRHNQPVLGMTILWDFHAHGDSWGGGEVLDPEGGSIYRANLRLRDNESRLEVHGYIGISVLGRSQMWERAAEPENP